MRFDEIAIERYGAFEQRALTLPKTGLVVVYGPNEAGKSTTLSAIGDFLFGVPPRTSRGAVFGNDAIRIQAALSRADGSSLTLRRRKGNVRTLTDSEGGVVEEATLAALLGPTDRDRFETLFGLDHERLRRGGERLLQAEGEIGRLIVEAGGGLSALVARLKAIDGEIDRLFAPRRSADRAFYKALDAFETADRDARDGVVTREKHEGARSAHGAAHDHATRLAEERRTLALSLSALERTARVIPLLRALDLAEQALAEVEIPDLPETFDANVQAAASALDDAERALAEAETASTGLAARLAAIAVDDRLVEAEAAIRDAAERATHLAKQRDDRPNRLRELADTSARLDGLRRRLGLGPEEDLGPRLPPEDAVRAVNGLAAAAAQRAPDIRTARKSIAEATAEIEALDARIAAELRAGRGAPVGVGTSEIAALTGATALMETKRAEGSAKAAAADEAARALGFAGVAALEALPCPDADWLARALSREEAADAERLKQTTLRADAEVRIDGASADIARLGGGREIASEATLAAARTARTAAWTPIRDAHLSGEASPDPATRRSETEALEAALGVADDMADRRAAEAERAAALAHAERTLRDATAAAEIAGRALGAIETALAQARGERASAFPDAVVRAPSLAALKNLAERRRDTLRAAQEASALLRDAEAARAQLSGPLAALDFAERACGLSPAAGATIAHRVLATTAAVERHDRAHAEHLRDVIARERAVSRLNVERRQLAALETEDAAWREAWAPAVRRLGLEPTVSADEAAAAAVEWSGARGVMTALDLIHKRIGAMDRDETDLASRIATAAEVTGVTPPEDAVAAARMLFDHFSENDGRRRDRETLAPAAKEAALLLSRRSFERQERRTAVARFADIVGLDADDRAGLLAVAARHAERKTLAQEIARLTDSLATAGDGRSIEELREAAAGRDLDEAKADVDATRSQVESADEQHGAAIRAEHDARAGLDALGSQDGANRGVVARESATAELHEAAEAYVELSLARDLVNEAIQKVRAERQDPLVARAGELFALATKGAFSGVGADVDDSGQPVVVGRRADGRTAHVAAMSDGTRDQLFLAFRLASLESYCRAAEPLPFVADDVLVHFDDERAQATLELLAEFASVTQVLLFTHHAGVRDMGAALAAQGRCGVVEIGG